MFRKFSLAVALTAICLSASAAEPAAVLKDLQTQFPDAARVVGQSADGTLWVALNLTTDQVLPSGRYLFVKVDKATGKVETTLVDMQGGDPVVPDPVVPPNSAFAKAVIAEVNKLAATEKRHECALKLSKTYEMLAGQTIAVDKTVEAVSTITTLALSSDAAAWSGVFGVVTAELAKCKTEAEADKILTAAGEAVGSTVPDAGDEKAAAERYGFDWDKFMEFLMQLLTVLLPLIIGI